MAALKTKGDLAELKVAADLARRGYRILFPYGEDCRYDLVAETDDESIRIQVKYTESDGKVATVRCYSSSVTNGKVKQRQPYTAESIDCIAVYDETSERCYYVPASILGSGRFHLSLRLRPAANNQKLGVHPAEAYLDPPVKRVVRLPLLKVENPTTLFMEPAGFEPAASALQRRRSAN